MNFNDEIEIIEAVDFRSYPGLFAAEFPDLLRECSNLYSEHYGVWAETSEHPGEKIRLSDKKIRGYLTHRDTHITLAYIEDTLIGYAIILRTSKRNYGKVSWVTQLVVHTDYRNQRVAKGLLSEWSFSDNYAWGIVTANPYAIRALETSTRRRCMPKRIQRNYRMLRNIGRQLIWYITQETIVKVNSNVSKINTKFRVDHSELPEMLENATNNQVPWLMGAIEEGWEWFAFTFIDQAQTSLTHQEINTFLNASDKLTRHAYSRMVLDSSHRWAQHTSSEVDYILKHCEIPTGGIVFDFGCGQGRHSIELAKRGMNVTGIDYGGAFISKAQEEASNIRCQNVRFIKGDVRSVNLMAEADSVICLYDVIGTYADPDKNKAILRNLQRHVKPGGTVLISVMNYELTSRIAKNWFSLQTNPDELLRLKPSRTMERTGDIFDPEYYMIDRDTKVVYRREQFQFGKELPLELVIRDRRYELNEVVEMCNDVGLQVESHSFVRAGGWDTPLDRSDNAAKEILVLCRNMANRLFGTG